MLSGTIDFFVQLLIIFLFIASEISPMSPRCLPVWNT